jgi:O-antigen/teichoic acid export membrane protein
MVDERSSVRSNMEGARPYRATLSSVVRYLITSGVLRGSATALSIKFTGSILGFTMFALCARHMDHVAFGSLAIVFNAMSFLAVVALCGQETLIVRSWDEYCASGRPALARGALRFGLTIVLSTALLMAAVVAIGWSFWDSRAPAMLIVAACSFLFAQSLMQFNGQFSRVAAGIFVGDSPREILWRFLVVIAILFQGVIQAPFTATEFFFTAAGAMAVSVGVQIWRVTRVFPDAVLQARSQADVTTWIPRSFRMWLSAMLDTANQYLEVIAIGFFLGPAAAALYFAATRITNIFGMIAASITGYATSQISGLFHTGARDELQRILRSLAAIAATLAAGAFLVIVLGGKLLLWTFGATYVSAYPALIVLAVGGAATSLIGPAAYLLLLTGNEGIYPRIMAVGLCARFILIALLAPWFGLMGVAVAWTLSATALSLALVIACRRLVSIDPSLASAIWRTAPPAIRLEGSVP